MEALSPPALGELLEGAALGLAMPGDAYGGLGLRPEPPPADAAMAYLAWGCAALAVLLSFALTRLNAGAWGLLPVVCGAFGGLVAAVPLGFAAAGVLHALSALSGGQRGYSRSVEAAALLGPVPALVAAALWAPDPAWLALPTLYATYLAVTAVEKLHDAPGGQAWMVLGFCGALLAGGEVLARDSVTLALVRLENAATVISNNPGGAGAEASTSARLSAPSASLAPPGVERPAGSAGGSSPIEADPNAPAAAAQKSSLDYLRGESGAEDQALPEKKPDPVGAQTQAMQAAGSNLISNLRKQIDSNPNIMNGMTPEQAAKIRKVLTQFENNMKGGQGGPMLTPVETQQLLQQIMSGSFKGAAPAGGAAKTKRRPAAAPAD